MITYQQFLDNKAAQESAKEALVVAKAIRVAEAATKRAACPPDKRWGLIS